MSRRPLTGRVRGRLFIAGLLIVAIVLLQISLSAQGDPIYHFIVARYNSETEEASLQKIATDGQSVEVLDTIADHTSGPVQIFSNPSVAPNGESVIYTGTLDDSPVRLFSAPLNGGTGAELTGSTANSQSGAVYSPDGTKIAYLASTGAGQPADVFVMNADGTNVVQITATPDFSEFSLSWSPDGQALVFVQRSADNQSFKLIVQPVDGGAPSPVGEDARVRLNPSFSPDGTRILYAQQQFSPPGASIFSVLPDGSDPQVVHSITGPENAATVIDQFKFSEDGRLLAYIQATFAESSEYSLHILDTITGTLLSPEWDLEGDYLIGFDWWNMPDVTQMTPLELFRFFVDLGCCPAGFVPAIVFGGIRLRRRRKLRR